MGSIGTFGSFTQARLAIYAAQKGLSVTGNNISNVNTVGYTRQRVDQSSFGSTGSDRYYSSFDSRVGNGVLCTGLSQLRDPYLDIRYRNEMSSVGSMDAKLAGLENIQAVLDEVGDGDDAFGIIEAQLSDLASKLRQLTDQTGHELYDIQVRASAEALTTQLNAYAARLQQVYENAVTAYNQDIKSINTILTNIRGLNATIRKNEIHGDNSLELRDERNLLIDQLSEYMKIDVTYTTEDIGGGQWVEKLVIKLGDANPDASVNTDSTTLIDGIYGSQFSLTQVPKPNPNFDKTIADSDTNPRYLDKDGNPTNDAANAALIDDPNFGLTVSELTDVNGRLLYTTEKQAERKTDATEYGNGTGKTTVNADGSVTITTFRKYKDNAGIETYWAQDYIRTPSKATDLDDNDLYGALQSQREMLTESGEFSSADTIANVDENAASKRGLPYYQKTLDLLANRLAAEFNKANQGYVYNEHDQYVTADGTVITDPTKTLNNTMTLTACQKAYLEANGVIADNTTDPPTYKTNAAGEYVDANGQALQVPLDRTEELTDDVKAILDANGGQLKGSVLFSNRNDNDDATGITASNISISASWSSGPQIVRSFLQPSTLNEIASTDSSNIDHLLFLFDQKMDYRPDMIDDEAGSDVMFTGSFQEMWVNIGSVLGNDMKVTSTLLDAYYASSVSLDTSRDSVSSVDFNDEAMNLMQYSKSYNAACRLMTTIDSVLDKLINGTGVTL